MLGADETGQTRHTAQTSETKISAHKKPPVYQIRINGQLDNKWTGYFEGFSIALDEHGDTILTGTVIDQAMLHGLFKKIRDLGLVLISVATVDEAKIIENTSND
jgi:hypothetical protein